jgi:hypothetical protein
MLTHYSAALDEIYQLRVAAAYEAAVTANTLLGYASLPAGARRRIEGQYGRLARAARGEATAAYKDVPSLSKQEVLRAAGAPMALTRGSWEARPR